MGTIPRERALQTVERRRLLEYLPSFIGNFRPIPSGPHPQRDSLGLGEVRNEVDSATELVGAVEGSRFRDTFGQQVLLTAGESECLENLEAELKAAGLMEPDQVLVQSFSRSLKGRMQFRCRSNNSAHVDETPKTLKSFGKIQSAKSRPLF